MSEGIEYPDDHPDPEKLIVLNVVGAIHEYGVSLRSLLSHLDGGDAHIFTRVVPPGDRIQHLITLSHKHTTGHIALDVAEMLGFDAHLTNFAGERI
jgi:hypothetical protein